MEQSEKTKRTLYIRAKFERGERQIREGKGVPHEQAEKRIPRWIG